MTATSFVTKEETFLLICYVQLSLPGSVLEFASFYPTTSRLTKGKCFHRWRRTFSSRLLSTASARIRN